MRLVRAPTAWDGHRALWDGPPRSTARTPLLEPCYTSIHTSIHTILNSAGEKNGENRCADAPRTPRAYLFPRTLLDSGTVICTYRRENVGPWTGLHQAARERQGHTREMGSWEWKPTKYALCLRTRPAPPQQQSCTARALNAQQPVGCAEMQQAYRRKGRRTGQERTRGYSVDTVIDAQLIGILLFLA